MTPPAKMTKLGMTTIPVFQNTRWGRGWWRLSPVIMIKSQKLTEDILSNQEYEQWWYDSWFTDEFSEESSELSSKPEEI